MNIEDRVSPQAPEVEEAVIGACLIEQDALPMVAGMLRPEMFYVMRHQLIYSAMMAMYQAGTKIDILTVKEELARRGKLEEAGGPTEGLGIVLVAKQRNGETGNVYFGHNPEMTKISDYIPPMGYLQKHAK